MRVAADAEAVAAAAPCFEDALCLLGFAAGAFFSNADADAVCFGEDERCVIDAARCCCACACEVSRDGEEDAAVAVAVGVAAAVCFFAAAG